MRKVKVYTADFETNVSDENIEEEITDVWLNDICSIDDYSHITSNTIEEFFNNVILLGRSIIYFHNLKFDGSFILDYLLKNGYKHTTSNKLKMNEFSTIISDMGMFYSIKVRFNNQEKKAKIECEFRDSAKKINGKVEDIARDYNLPILKGKIDYKKRRVNPYTPTQEEIEYIHNDTEIIARVLNMQYSLGMTQLTTASDTYNDYKKFCGNSYKLLFPTLDIETDDFIRLSYRGGVCMVAPQYQNRVLNNVVVYDVNSMYPDKMCRCDLPYGRPKYYQGKYVSCDTYPLYIQRILVCCKVKKGYYPTILIRATRLSFKDYLTDTNGMMQELTLTSVDIDLLFKHYDIFDIKFLDGYMFMSSKNLFKKYLLPIYEKKCTTKGAEKQLNKLKLNALYGKFASNPRHYSKIPYLENNKVKYKNSECEIGKPIYTAVSCFITSYARKQLFEAIQNNYDIFVYCDTDSVHLLKEVNNIPIDDKRLGDWKLEKVYQKAKYLAQKTYFGSKDDKNDIKIAGAPKDIKDVLTFDKFDFGFTANGKLLPKTVNGGVILYSTDFTIKERK